VKHSIPQSPNRRLNLFHEAIPSARHPAPETLTMPDFSKPLGGWGSGASVSNAVFYLAVLEEYGTGTVSNHYPRLGDATDLLS